MYLYLRVNGQFKMFPVLVVNLLIFSLRDHRLQVLLTNNQKDPPRNQWELPGTPIRLVESFEQTASQELSRLLGGREAYLEQLYTYGDPGRNPIERTISVVYFALVPASAGTTPSSIDDQIIQWFPVDELPPLAMDFGEIILYGLRRLRYKLEYTAVGFQLLPEEFTLSELQRTYEMILGETLDKRNFRRRILEAGIIEPTTHFSSGEGRPAQFYRYNSDAVAEVKARRLFP